MNEPVPSGSDTGHVAEVGLLFAELATALHRATDTGVDSELLVTLAARAIPHAEQCGVTVQRRRQRPKTTASSGPLPTAVDELQYTTGEGPCLDAATGDDLVLANDLSTDTRWPAFSRLCVEKTGVRSMLCVRLAMSGDNRAAINFYADRVDAFAEVDVSVATVLAPLAAGSLQARIYQEEAAELQVALSTSRQIGAAVGILMAQRGLTYDEAFDQLRKASQHLNVKLRDLAAEVQWTGALPDSASGKDSSGVE